MGGGNADQTYLAMFLWTKISPGLDPVTTDSGTLESEQPIHNTYQQPSERGKRVRGLSACARPSEYRRRISSDIKKKTREMEIYLG